MLLELICPSKRGPLLPMLQEQEILPIRSLLFNTNTVFHKTRLPKTLCDRLVKQKRSVFWVKFVEISTLLITFLLTTSHALLCRLISIDPPPQNVLFPHRTVKTLSRKRKTSVKTLQPRTAFTGLIAGSISSPLKPVIAPVFSWHFNILQHWYNPKLRAIRALLKPFSRLKRNGMELSPKKNNRKTLNER